MPLCLVVDRPPWIAHVERVAASRPGLLPVVKGNGYGFGRRELMPIAAALSDQIAVGTVYECADVPADRRAAVLTPHLGSLPAALRDDTLLTVGSDEHVHTLIANRWRGEVIVKLRSSMRRYGVGADQLPSLLAAIAAAGCTVATFALHFGLSGESGQFATEVEQWLPSLPVDAAVSVSHLAAEDYGRLVALHPQRRFRYRCGTELWHGQRHSLRLQATVLSTAAVRAGTPVGYRANPAPGDGTIVLVGAGSAHGVSALDDGRSPFHFDRTRLALLEAPHMHTSMVFVAEDARCPQVGDVVDVQRPLTMTLIDELHWIDGTGDRHE